MITKIQKDIRTQTFGYISAALGLVAGLAWNEAIKTLIDTLFPLSKDTVVAKFAYAIIITGLIVVLLQYLEKVLKKESEEKSV
jgi:hypothetical protein